MATKALKIVGVRTIFNIGSPIVVFDVQGHPSIVRNPRQALVDLQNGARALDIPLTSLSNGIEGMNSYLKGEFQKALLRCKGANIEGDFTIVNTGDKYYPADNHPVFTDSKHKDYGSIKQGGSLIATQDGVWVNGFCTIAETEQDLAREADANAWARVRGAMLGQSMSVPTAVAETLPEIEALDAENVTANEAFATANDDASASKGKK